MYNKPHLVFVVQSTPFMGFLLRRIRLGLQVIVLNSESPLYGLDVAKRMMWNLAYGPVYNFLHILHGEKTVTQQCKHTRMAVCAQFLRKKK